MNELVEKYRKEKIESDKRLNAMMREIYAEDLIQYILSLIKEKAENSCFYAKGCIKIEKYFYELKIKPSIYNMTYLKYVNIEKVMKYFTKRKFDVVYKDEVLKISWE